MIVCPNCKHTNMAGAMFCSECGAHLIASDNLTTQTIAPGQVDSDIGNPAEAQKMIAGKLDTWGNLHLLETGQMLPLSDRNEFTLGRISEGQPIMPDIDLSPYHAYAGGVSRLHAVLRRNSNRVTIMDLGSSNGTYINGKRLEPNVEQTLRHGDIIVFGKLKLQVLLKDE